MKTARRPAHDCTSIPFSGQFPAESTQLTPSGLNKNSVTDIWVRTPALVTEITSSATAEDLNPRLLRSLSSSRLSRESQPESNLARHKNLLSYLRILPPSSDPWRLTTTTTTTTITPTGACASGAALSLPAHLTRRMFCVVVFAALSRDGDGHAAAGGSWVGEDGRVWHSHDGLAPHSHEPIYSPGDFTKRAPPLASRTFADRAFTVGIGGPVGTG
ncbi:hypothetical protein HU200_026470 [Digitaria exilis]|uniref:Uncharacterized protein n=1 Tax=Digitaria exilis TaxID=1010633 RepID=A0A835C0I3_9POAL|nr:hypothetical protein HU200_026470 [Digitaria exilis]